MKPYAVTYHDPGYLEAVYRGGFTTAEIAPLICGILSLVKEYNCFLFLGDFSGLEFNISLGTIYQVPRQISLAAEKVDIQIGRLKRALIGSRAHYDEFRFFETVSLNRVQNVRVFLERDEARAWLLET